MINRPRVWVNCWQSAHNDAGMITIHAPEPSGSLDAKAEIPREPTCVEVPAALVLMLTLAIFPAAKSKNK